MSLQDRIKEVEQLQKATNELMDLFQEILSKPTPPHADYWHQSIHYKEQAVKNAYKNCLLSKD